MQGDFTACKNNELQKWCCMCFASSISFSASLVFCISGGGRDLDGKPGAVLQTLLRVHVQHLIIDSSPSPASPFLSSVKRHTLISLLPHLIVGQSPPPPLYPLKKPTSILLHPETSPAGRIQQACYTVPHKHTHTTIDAAASLAPSSNARKTRETPHWIRNNIPIISLFFLKKKSASQSSSATLLLLTPARKLSH